MQNISSLISSAIQSLYQIDFSPEITPAPKSELGEYCIGVFQLAKPLGKAPNIIATELATELAKHTDIFVSTSSIGGYVNFFLTDTVWMEIFRGINAQKKEKNNETIVVDYIGANVGKPLHIGHICTPSIGQVICNTYRHLGYEVIGDSHFGDWGGIFGKLIWGWKYENIENIIIKISELEGISVIDIKRNLIRESKGITKSALLEKFKLNFLMALYQLSHQFHPTVLSDSSQDIKKLVIEEEEQKDGLARLEFQYLSGVGIDVSNAEELRHHEENVELWKKFTTISIAETEAKLKLLNVEATYNIGESFYEGLDLPRPNNEDYPNLGYTMKDIVAELIEKGIATQNEDGSVGVIFSEESKLPSCILQKKDGTGLYLTSDLAAIKYRLTNGWNPSKLIYCVDVRQQLHLRQAFTIAKMAWPELTENVEFFHAFNGFIKLKEGAMSTRHGTVIFLEKLIEEGFEKTKSILEEKGRSGENSLEDKDIRAITIAAIKYSYLAQDREKDVVFDWDKALSFEGNSGPYIQYAYVRAKKISTSPLPSPEGEGVTGTTSPLGRRGDREVRLSIYDKSLIQSLARMEMIIEETATKYKPHILALYCYDLAVTFNSFYVHTPKILEESDITLRNFRLQLCTQFVEQIRTGFELLGIMMPSEM